MLEVEANGQKPKKKISKVWNVLLCIGLLILIVIVLFSLFFNDQKILKYNTEKYLKEYVSYPDTFELKTIYYNKCENKDEDDLELWKMTGYFEAESKVGLEVKSNYIVYIKFNKVNKKCMKYSVIIDNVKYC